jgi:Ca2+-dependent lipid-binding protein
MAPQPKKFIKKNGVNMMNPEYLVWKKKGGKKPPAPKWQDPIDFMMVQYQVIQAKDLVAKDRNLFGKKTSSDPFVKVSLLCTPTKTLPGQKRRAQKIDLGKTETKKKNLNPTWNFTKASQIPFSRQSETLQLVFDIFDEDLMSSPDSLGSLTLSPLKWENNRGSATWYEIPKNSGKKVSGEIKINVNTEVHRVQGLRPYT